MNTSSKVTAADTVYAVSMALACFVSYEVAHLVLTKLVGSADQFLGGMWATVATVFVFKDPQSGSVAAGLARLLATGVSFVVCFAYLCLFPFTPAGLAVVIGVGTLIMLLLGRRDDITTTGITSAVVMVVAAMSPQNAWEQPLLRVLDTVVGIVIGVIFDWLRWSLTTRAKLPVQA